LYRSTDVVVMSIAFVPPNTASSRGSRVVFKSPRLLRPLFGVIGDDEIAQVVVRDIARQDDLPAERVRDAFLEEVRGVRAVGEIGRLANRAIGGHESMYQFLVLRILPLATAVGALKNRAASQLSSVRLLPVFS
jgi:hypothetical protein